MRAAWKPWRGLAFDDHFFASGRQGQFRQDAKIHGIELQALRLTEAKKKLCCCPDAGWSNASLSGRCAFAGWSRTASDCPMCCAGGTSCSSPSSCWSRQCHCRRPQEIRDTLQAGFDVRRIRWNAPTWMASAAMVAQGAPRSAGFGGMAWLESRPITLARAPMRQVQPQVAKSQTSGNSEVRSSFFGQAP